MAAPDRVGTRGVGARAWNRCLRGFARGRSCGVFISAGVRSLSHVRDGPGVMVRAAVFRRREGVGGKNRRRHPDRNRRTVASVLLRQAAHVSASRKCHRLHCRQSDRSLGAVFCVEGERFQCFVSKDARKRGDSAAHGGFEFGDGAGAVEAAVTGVAGGSHRDGFQRSHSSGFAPDFAGWHGVHAECGASGASSFSFA